MYNIAIQLYCNKGTVPVLLAQCMMYNVTGYKNDIRCKYTIHHPVRPFMGVQPHLQTST